MRLNHSGVILLLTLGTSIGGCAGFASTALANRDAPDERMAVISRAQVWARTSTRSANMKQGPRGTGAFPFRATVTCDYVNKRLDGNSPKFMCVTGKDDELKVKFGGANGEVYGEVLATRLLWALGFGADRMYPVTIICRGCPESFGGVRGTQNERRFDPAVIERKMPGREWPADGPQGWHWNELNAVNDKAGGAPLEHRDALKLLAVFLQHTDSKPAQQRIVCLTPGPSRAGAPCRRPFLMISDVGLTFGRANRANANETGSVNLDGWRGTPVWKATAGCVGNLPKSFTGTLQDPVISERGRRFLAGLLAQLSDRQIRDLFEVARVTSRLRSPADPLSGFVDVEEWVAAFKEKRQQIVSRRCA